MKILKTHMLGRCYNNVDKTILPKLEGFTRKNKLWQNLKFVEFDARYIGSLFFSSNFGPTLQIPLHNIITICIEATFTASSIQNDKWSIKVYYFWMIGIELEFGISIIRSKS